MPKISALTSLAQASVDTAADVLPIVDATAPATTKKVTVQAMVNAGLATLTTLPSGIVNASLNSITPAGGTLAVTGAAIVSGRLETQASQGAFFGNASGVYTTWGTLTPVGDVGTGNIIFGSASSDLAINARGANLLQLGTGDVPRITLSASGAAVTGSISATAISETFTSTAATTSPRSLHLSNTGGDVYFGIEGSSGGGYFTGSTAYATVVYSTQQPVQTIINGVKRTEVDSSGLSVTGSISATGLVDISAAGAGQIKFPATQNASADANTLDDYEEGSWTPTLSSDGTPPTVSQYVDRVGTYTKIGDLVFVRAVLRVDIANAGTGTPQITGFPYSSKGLEPPVFGLRDVLTSLPSSAYMLSGPKLTMNGPSYAVANGVYLVFTVCYQTN